MDVTKTQIGLLEGKSNWSTWKYKMGILLRAVKGGLDLVEGRLQLPTPVEEEASAEDQTKYKKTLTEFHQLDSHVLLIMTINMTQETLEKVMRYTSARDVWLELHRLYDGSIEDKSYDVCMQFFSYVKPADDDVTTHTSNLKNLWNSLQKEISKDRSCNCELPEILLICKILETLPADYFSFKSSWMLMSKNDRTIDNLTVQLCAFEKALSSKYESKQDVLHIERKSRNIICNYCKQKGHIVRNCTKWKADGRPPKPVKRKTYNNNVKAKNVSLLAEKTSVLSCETDQINWYVDNGATNHITNRKDLFQSFLPFDKYQDVTTANGDVVRAIGHGTIRVESYVNGKKHDFTLTEVWYIPDIRKNLFSTLAAQDKHPDSVFISKTKACFFKLFDEVWLEGSRNRLGGLYRLHIRPIKPTIPTEVNAITSENVLQLYHERFGHQNKRHIKMILKRELGINVNIDSEICEGCVYGKAHVLKFGTRDRAKAPGELLHTDVCGPFQKSMSGYRYFVLFKDDYSRYRFVYFMRHKSEVAEKLITVLAVIKTAGYGVKELLSDNGGEFDNFRVNKILNLHGIKQRLTMPYTPQQNGCSERENRTLVETARALMHAREGLFDQSFWAELINTASYILNRTSQSGVKDKVPYEVWYKKKPNISHLRVIGSTCYAHVSKKNRKKMDKKAIKGILMGYENDDGYRIWATVEKRLVRSRDVVFEELKPLQALQLYTTSTTRSASIAFTLSSTSTTFKRRSSITDTIS